MNYMDSIITQQQRDFTNKVDNVIKDAFTRNGIDVNDIEFLKANVSRINIEGDKFEHYFLFYGTRKQIRIISIQKTPDINNDYLDNKYMITATCKYY